MPYSVSDVIFLILILTMSVLLVSQGIFIDFFLKTRHSRLKYINLAIFFSIISYLFNILQETTTSFYFQYVNLLYGVGLVAYFYGILSILSFLDIEIKKLFNIIPFLIIVLSLGLSLIPDLIFSLIYYSILTFIFTVVLINFVLKRKKKLKAVFGQSYFSFFGLPILTLLFSIIVISFSSDDVRLVFNSFALVAILFSIFIFIQLEHGIVKLEKMEIRDKFSHDLANIHQILILTTDLILIQMDNHDITDDKDNLNEYIRERLNDLKTHYNKATSLITRIREIE